LRLIIVTVFWLDCILPCCVCTAVADEEPAPRNQGTRVLQSVKASPDVIAKSGDVIIDWSRHFACAARGNDGDAPVLLNDIANETGIISRIVNRIECETAPWGVSP